MQLNLRLSLAIQLNKAVYARQEELKELNRKKEIFLRRSWGQKGKKLKK